eukprot:1716173-Rhodomonas_salina.1
MSLTFRSSTASAGTETPFSTGYRMGYRETLVQYQASHSMRVGRYGVEGSVSTGQCTKGVSRDTECQYRASHSKSVEDTVSYAMSVLSTLHRASAGT